MRLDKFLFCETVRNEVTGQLTVVGLFQTDVLRTRLPAGTTAFSIPTLACVAVFDHMAGIPSMKVECEVKLENEPIQRSPSMPVTRQIKEDRYQTVTVTFAPFTCPKAGDYTFKLTIEAGGETTSFSRRLKIETEFITNQTVAPSNSRPH